MQSLAKLRSLPDEGRECIAELARNQAKAIVSETSEEKIVSKLRDIMYAQDRDRENTEVARANNSDFPAITVRFEAEVKKVREWALLAKSMYPNVFATDDAVAMLANMLRLGKHFRKAPFMKLASLAQMCSGTHGGVSCLFRLRLNI
jgi:hypothetical protein